MSASRKGSTGRADRVRLGAWVGLGSWVVLGLGCADAALQLAAQQAIDRATAGCGSSTGVHRSSSNQRSRSIGFARTLSGAWANILLGGPGVRHESVGQGTRRQTGASATRIPTEIPIDLRRSRAASWESPAGSVCSPSRQCSVEARSSDWVPLVTPVHLAPDTELASHWQSQWHPKSEL